MSKSTCAVLVLFVLTLVPHSWAVPNAVVGTCVAGKQFTTIQGAIDAADIGSTVRVCPGTYPEILTITKDINVKSITSGTGRQRFHHGAFDRSTAEREQRSSGFASRPSTGAKRHR